MESTSTRSSSLPIKDPNMPMKIDLAVCSFQQRTVLAYVMTQWRGHWHSTLQWTLASNITGWRLGLIMMLKERKWRSKFLRGER
jgi:hypothetical protein